MGSKLREDASRRSGDGACAGCGAEGTASRCEHCGVAREVRGMRVVQVLSQGPGGRVYIAEGERGRVALKELAFAAIPDPAIVDAFRREAAMLRQLDHPAIPKLLDAFEEGTGVHTRLYLAQELVEGRTLAQELEERRCSEDEALAIARDVLGTLVWLQSRAPPVVHRDLKPANLVRRPDGRIAIVDFGSARDAVTGTLGATLDVGTWGYMPPEQLAGDVGMTTDLYALGATLVHLLTRRAPRDILRKRTLRGSVAASEKTLAFLEGLVAPDPSGRFADAATALRALERGEGVAANATRSSPVSRTALLVAGATALLLAGLVAIVTVVAGGGGATTVVVQAPEKPEAYVAPPAVDVKVPPENEAAWSRLVNEHGVELPGVTFGWEAVVAHATVAELETAVQQDVWMKEAQKNLEVIGRAEEAWARANDRKPLLWTDESREEVWRTLGVTELPFEIRHRYTIALDPEGFVLQAKGSTDADSFEDVVLYLSNIDGKGWNGGRFMAADSLNFEMTNFRFAPSSLDSGTPAWLQQLYETSRRRQTAPENLKAILRAQEILVAAEGRWLLFENGGPETWRTLGISLPHGVYHRYSAREVKRDGVTLLELVAEGDLDGDEAQDRWVLPTSKEKPWSAELLSDDPQDNDVERVHDRKDER